jgi:hypothetical protein
VSCAQFQSCSVIRRSTPSHAFTSQSSPAPSNQLTVVMLSHHPSPLPPPRVYPLPSHTCNTHSLTPCVDHAARHPRTSVSVTSTLHPQHPPLHSHKDTPLSLALCTSYLSLSVSLLFSSKASHFPICEDSSSLSPTSSPQFNT